MSRVKFGSKWNPYTGKYEKSPTVEVTGLNQATPEDWDRAREFAPALKRQVGGNHYKDCAIQPIEYIMANNMEYCPANIIKYATRADKKGGVEDIRKIIHYAELWLEAKESSE